MGLSRRGKRDRWDIQLSGRPFMTLAYPADFVILPIPMSKTG